MNYRSLSSTFVGALCITVLAACGGGGGDAPPPVTQPPVTTPPPTTASFPLAAGFKARIDAGASDTFDVSRGCMATVTIATSAAVATTFEAFSALASPQAWTVISNTNCPLPPASPTPVPTGTTYYNTAYANLGLDVSGGEYSKFKAAPIALPATAKIGDSGNIVTLDTYRSDRSTFTGTRVIRWTIEADGTSTTSAIFNVITENYNASSLLLSTQQSRYRMALNGALAITTIEVQFVGTAALDLLYTKR